VVRFSTTVLTSGLSSGRQAIFIGVSIVSKAIARSGPTTYDTRIDLDCIVYLDTSISYRNEQRGRLKQEGIILPTGIMAETYV
jgi:hypothetical protein